VAIVTLFPELFEPFFRTSLIGQAVESGRLVAHLEELRRHGVGRHRSVDDTPYGGGSGMLLRVDCVEAALESAESAVELGLVEERQARQWLEAIDAQAQAGSFVFTLNFYGVVGVKPA
jgi:tRNA (guanine-N1)-methyltransferase